MKKNKKIILAIMIVLAIIVLFVVQKYQTNVVSVNFIINSNLIDVKIGENKKIEYEIDDENREIIWTSADENIAIVNHEGIVYGINYGETIITGRVIIDNREIVKDTYVNVYAGDKNVMLTEVSIPDGDILMGVNSQFEIPIEMVPYNAYIKSIAYETSDANVFDIADNKIISYNAGTAELSITVNETNSVMMTVHVVDENIISKVVKKVESIAVNYEEINIKVNEKKKIEYTVIPSDGYIYSIEWENSYPDIVSVENGEIVGKKAGLAIVNLMVNGERRAAITVNVSFDVNGIKVDTYPKNVLKPGESTNIVAHVLPEETGVSISYTSSNPSVAYVNDGKITAVKSGDAIITLTADKKSVSTSIHVLPSSGVINGTGNLWGYQSLNEKTPIRADSKFFMSLTANGKGTLSGNVYSYNDGNTRYTYDIDKSLLTANGMKIMARFYYPAGVDTSSLNILTYMGGDGENNFSGLFSDAEKDRSIIRSAGIVVFVAEGSKYNASFTQESGYYATSFAKKIFNQKATAKTSIAGFSTGGTKVMGAANIGNYDRVIVFSSYYNWATTANNLKNKEIIFYIPAQDHLYTQAKATLRDMQQSGYTNVTIVSNNKEMASFGNKFLVINPGTLMHGRHVTENVTRARIFSYAND